MNFKDILSSAVRLLTGLTPLSGSKRRREDDGSGEHEDQRRTQAARTAQAGGSGAGALESTGAPAPESLAQQPPAPAYGRAAVEPKLTFAGFDMASRVRELAPRLHGNRGVPHGSSEPAQCLQDPQQQPQPAPQLNAANAAPLELVQPTATTGAVGGHPPAPQQLAFSVGVGAAAGPRRTSQPLSRPHQPPYPQPQVPMQAPAGARAGAPPVGPLLTPAAGPSLGGPPAHHGHPMGTPRQLFNTPDSTLRKFQGLQLSGSTPRGQAAGVAAAAAPSRLSAAATGRDASSFAASGAATKAGGAAVAAIVAAGAGAAVRAPRWIPPAPPPRSGYTASAHKAFLHQQQQQHQQQFHTLGLPFYRAYAGGLEDLGFGHIGLVQTGEELRQIVRDLEARARSHAPAAAPPLREDGGYVSDDEEENGKRTTALTQDARSVVERLRSGIAATARKASGDPRVVAASVGSKAARNALEVTQATAGADALAAIGLKMATHDQMVRQLQAAAEADTRRSLEAVKADEAARRVQMQQRNQQLRRGLALTEQQPAAAAAAAAAGTSAPSRAVPPGATGSAAVAAAAAVARPASGRRPAAAPQPQSRPPLRARPAVEEEVLDLVSSDEEEEGEGEEEEGKEGEEEEGEDGAADPYGVPYGSYPGEERGGGNTALRLASRSERSTWRRIMNKRAPGDEVLVDFNPNSVLKIELPRAKLVCMNLGVWLNDEVINLYMLLLQERDTRFRRAAAAAAAAAQAAGRPAPRAPPRCHFFNSFFYNKLFQDDGRYNYANVRRWTAPKQLSNKLQDSSNVLEVDRILMPIHKGVHWTCAEIDLRARAIRYYDSLMGEDPSLPGHLLQWLADESADKLKQRWDVSKWSVEFPKDIPEQENGCDCGVFSIMFADRRGAGAPLDFRQSDMPLLRIKVLHRVVSTRVE